MARVRFSPEFTQAVLPERDLEVDVEGGSLADALRKATRGAGIEDQVFPNAGGEVDPGVHVYVDGDRVRSVLGAMVGGASEIVVSTAKGNAGPFDNV